MASNLRKQSCILHQSFRRILLYKEQQFQMFSEKDVIAMSVKERILTIRLMEKLAEKPVLSDALGLTPVNEIVISNRQDDSA